MRKGIDLSYHQGKIDFSKVRKAGIDFVILREGYGTTIDPKFHEYAKGAIENDIGILGVYHFSYAKNVQEARTEAEICAKHIETAGLSKYTLVFYDFEYDTVTKAAKKGILLNRAECNEFTVAFCEKIKSYGYVAGFYANKDYRDNWYAPDVLAKYPLWLADYSDKPDSGCIILQYSSKGSVPGISTNVDLDYYYEDFKMSEKIYSRDAVVKLAESWLGKNEKDGTHKSIIDIYNSYKGSFPRGVKMKYDWPWCACTWSALAIKLGYTAIMPIEISCVYLIEAAKKMGIWVENDGYIPLPGDAILYDWDDNGKGDNTGNPDHVGMIEYVNKDAGYMVVIEGNYSDFVKKRTISLNGMYIRGFITPKYTDDETLIIPDRYYTFSGISKDLDTIAREVISGLWGNGESRKEALERTGLKYEDVQKKVNEILNGFDPKEPKKLSSTCYAQAFDVSLKGTYQTTANLYCRNDAGSNKRALCLISKGTLVKNYGYYSMANGVKWYLIEVNISGVKYEGFSSSKYLKKM